jgi:PAS domain S-box-containing protein
LTPDEFEQAIHELCVRQIELEIQNEELRRTQAELEASRGRYFDLYDLAPVGYLTLSEQGLIVEANLAAAKLLGVTRDALVNQPLSSLIHPADQDIHCLNFKQLFEKSAPLIWEVRLLREGAAPLWVSLEATMVRDSDGTPVCGAVVSDITDRKRSETLRAYLAAIVDSSDDAIIGKDLEGTVLSWNAAAERLYGYSAGEIVGHLISLLIPPGHADELAGILERIRRGESVDHFETERVCKDGRRIEVALTISAIRDREGRIEGASTIARDITEAKRVRNELISAQRRTAAILESMSDGFSTFDDEWRYIYVNPAAAKMLGKGPGELLGTSLWEQWPHVSESPFGAAFRRAVAENVPVQVEAFYPKPLNAWFEVRCYPSPDGLSLFFTDVTQRKRLEQAREETVRALESAVAEKTVLLKEVHHRVKNNLAVIASLLSMRAAASSSREARLALEESQQRVQSMALVHEHLYGSAHLDRINFSDYAQKLLRDLYSVCVSEPGRIALEMDVDPIEIDIEQAVPCALMLNELLSNAFKYAFPDARRGKIRVSLHESEDGFLELAIEDNGIGLPPGLLSAENIQSLGLRIVNILAKQLEGSLEQQAGPGTRILFRFPAHCPS